ncbi:uncharacterized protein [Aristolochia californica]|uniref:uncharacterized protein n=1 Tax=Aristolochia californica TaxID=171875 RepID=UPI0035D8E8AA
MQRTDANNEYWKAKFIDGLPTLFASKVRKRLGNEVGIINYQQYTYGLLTSAIIQEGLTLCNDLKLQTQLKQQNLTGKRELGEFCDQFACGTEPRTSHQRKGKGKASHAKRPEPYSHQSRRYPKRQSHQKTRPEPRRPPPRQRHPPRRNLPDKKKIVCYKCDIEYTSSSQSEDNPDCSCSHLQSVAQMHQINVLTSLQHSIDQEEDPQTKRYLIKEYLDKIQSTSKSTPIQVILGTPFLEKIMPIKGIDNHGIHGQLETLDIKNKISSLHRLLTQEICSDIPTAFWDRHKYIVSLPYIDGFNERTIPTKARPSQMKHALLDLRSV